jgi:hypothetical protein
VHAINYTLLACDLVTVSLVDIEYNLVLYSCISYWSSQYFVLKKLGDQVLHLHNASDKPNEDLQLNPYVVTSDTCPCGTDVWSRMLSTATVTRFFAPNLTTEVMSAWKGRCPIS